MGWLNSALTPGVRQSPGQSCRCAYVRHLVQEELWKPCGHVSPYSAWHKPLQESRYTGCLPVPWAYILRCRSPCAVTSAIFIGPHGHISFVALLHTVAYAVVPYADNPRLVAHTVGAYAHCSPMMFRGCCAD
jgi:hypothetical protein